MDNLYKKIEKINNCPKRIGRLKIVIAILMTIILIILLFFIKRMNIIATVILVVAIVIFAILLISIHIIEKNNEKELNKIKSEYKELKIKNHNNISDISITVLGTTFLKGFDNDGEILIIGILVDDTIECQYMSEKKIYEIFEL